MANNINVVPTRGITLAVAITLIYVILLTLTRHRDDETIQHLHNSLDLADQHPNVEQFHGRQLRLMFDPKSVVEKAHPAEADEGGRPLVHVFNPFHHPISLGFSPLGFEQWSMLASVHRAKQNFVQSRSRVGPSSLATSAFDEVLVVCAVLEMDLDVLNGVLSNYCDRVELLPRNTATEYSMLNLKPLPFVQDIIDLGIAVGNIYDDFHLMITNSDICLTEDYYTHLDDMLTKTQGKAFTINRMTIPHYFRVPQIIEGSSFNIIHEAAMKLLQQAALLYKQGKFMYHPGVDCFVAHSSVWTMVQFGDLFLGFPPFDWHIKLAFEIMVPSYQEVRSNTQGTFHLADERSWIRASVERFHPEFGPPGPVLKMLAMCPRMLNSPTDPHSLLNGINCGKLFHPPEPNVAPAFVRAGYEGVYQQAFVAKGKEIGDYGAFPPHLCKSKSGPCGGAGHFMHTKQAVDNISQLVRKFGVTTAEGNVWNNNN